VPASGLQLAQQSRVIEQQAAHITALEEQLQHMTLHLQRVRQGLQGPRPPACTHALAKGPRFFLAWSCNGTPLQQPAATLLFLMPRLWVGGRISRREAKLPPPPGDPTPPRLLGQSHHPAPWPLTRS
jgi:hypothetical protein